MLIIFAAPIQLSTDLFVSDSVVFCTICLHFYVQIIFVISTGLFVFLSLDIVPCSHFVLDSLRKFRAATANRVNKHLCSRIFAIVALACVSTCAIMRDKVHVPTMLIRWFQCLETSSMEVSIYVLVVVSGPLQTRNRPMPSISKSTQIHSWLRSMPERQSVTSMKLNSSQAAPQRGGISTSGLSQP
jgi:hypothetical protein